MELYRIKATTFNAENPEQKLAKGSIVTFEDSERALNAIKAGLAEKVEVIHIATAEETETAEEAVEETAEETETATNYADWKVDDLKALLDEAEVEYDNKAKKAELVELAEQL